MSGLRSCRTVFSISNTNRNTVCVRAVHLAYSPRQWGPLDENRIGQLGWEFTKLEAQVCAQAAPCSQLHGFAWTSSETCFVFN